MGRNRFVMLIDDEPVSRADVQAMLRSAPVAIVADCGYGVEASSLAEELHPELILAAVEAPVDRAIQTLRAVRDVLPDCEIIAYSSLADFGVMRQVMQLGVRDFLPCPLQVADVTAALAGTLPEDAAVPASGAPKAAAAGVVLTVFGAKGGIGKSTIATNLAAVIAHRTSLSVLLMDMDTRFGDVAIMMDIEPRYTIADLAANVEGLDRQIFRDALIQHESGAHVLAAPKYPAEWGNISAEQMRELIQFGARLFDYVILDTPGTFNDIVATAIESAARVLVVSSLDMASIKDTAYMFDLLEAEGFPGERLHLTVNHVNKVNTIKAADLERIVHHEIFWEIPYDEQVLRASQAGRPVVLTKPKARAAQQLTGLAEKIAGPQLFGHANGNGWSLRRLVPHVLPWQRRQAPTW